MTIELLARNIEPAGFEEQPEKKVIDSIDAEVLARLNEAFDVAEAVIPRFGLRDLIKDKNNNPFRHCFPYTVPETLFAAMRRTSQLTECSLSLAWELLPQDAVITYELPLKLNNIGTYSSKTLVNCAALGDRMAENHCGIVLNYGAVGKEMGLRHTGTIVNYGNAGDYFGYYAEGLSFNLGEASFFECYRKGTLVDFTKNEILFGWDWALTSNVRSKKRAFPSKLESYLTDMRAAFEAGRTDPAKAIEVVKHYDQASVMKTLQEGCP
jgi:hypothetical protein